METFSLFHFATQKANYTFLAQTVNRKRPFTRRIFYAKNKKAFYPPPLYGTVKVRLPYMVREPRTVPYRGGGGFGRFSILRLKGLLRLTV